MNLQDDRNRSTWARRTSRRWLDGLGDFTDLGERAALELVREQVRGRPILDLGVGTGRTIPLLSSLTNDYRGVDYLQSMVDACHARYPFASVELKDARDLVGVPSRHFGLVNFSFNGIDAVGHDDRARVLAEMRRVVCDDGFVVFSTLNLEGPAFGERPWIPRVARSRSAVLRVARTAKALVAMPFDVVRWMQLQRVTDSGPGWAVAPLSAHHYGVMAHFTTLDRERDELARANLDHDVVVIDNETGASVAPGSDTSASTWFHIVARART